MPTGHFVGARSTERSAYPMSGLALLIVPPATGRLRFRPAASLSKRIRVSACLIFCAPPPLSQLGRIEEAKVPAQRGLELEPGFTVSGFLRAHTGRAEIWEPISEALRRLSLPE